MKTIRIDIVSDVVCPWCYVGKKRLENAIAQSPEYSFEIHWFPFQLSPFIPQEGVNQQEYLAQKLGGKHILEQAQQNLELIGKEVGIDFRFDKIEKAINTFHLHRILMAVGESGKQTALKTAFLSAYFEKALDLTDQNVIRQILENVGFAKNHIEELLDETFFAEQTSLILQDISKQNVRGVPLFIIDQKYGISGAQPEEVFLQTFAKIAPVVQTDLACAIDNPTC